MENLKVFDGGANLVAELPQPGHRLWSTGVNSAGVSLRSLRILMPLSLAVNILENADPRKFVETAGAMVCPIEVLKAPPKVYFLKMPMIAIDLSEVNAKAAHCKVLELPLNYEEHMVRYQFRTLPKQGRTYEEWMAKTEEYIKQWIELLVAEKRRQMNITECALWPQRLPWPVHNVYDMPIVLWMSKATKQ